MYHLLIEATLGLTAFEFITRYLRDNDLLPGFVEGYGRIHHDEQRHIGYGIWFLRESAGRDAELADRVRETLRDLLPSVAAALAPPDREGTDWEALGASGDEIRDFALKGLTRRLEDRRRAALEPLTAGIMGLFEFLRALSFLNSTVFTFLLFFWLAPGYEAETTVLWLVPRLHVDRPVAAVARGACAAA